MSEENFERVLESVDPARRATFRKLVPNAAFSVPVIASFSVKELGAAAMARMTTTSLRVTNSD
jgi:hypothetical protein